MKIPSMNSSLRDPALGSLLPSPQGQPFPSPLLSSLGLHFCSQRLNSNHRALGSLKLSRSSPPDSDIKSCSCSFLDCLSYVLEYSNQPTVSLGGSAQRATLAIAAPALSMIPARIKAEGSSILFLKTLGPSSKRKSTS